MIYFIGEFKGMFPLNFSRFPPFYWKIIKLVDLIEAYECRFFQARQARKYSIVIRINHEVTAAMWMNVEIFICQLNIFKL
ncbi:hypothetical protein BH23THE1_BH23THE1_27900 [soil metagenome]